MKRFLLLSLLLLLSPTSSQAQSRTANQLQDVAFSALDNGNPPARSIRYCINCARANGPCTTAGVGDPIGTDALKTPDGWMCSSRAAGDGTGSVISVGLSLPSMFSVSGSPVTTTGTLTATLATQSANTVLAGPPSGGAAVPTFRTRVAADLGSGGSSSTDVLRFDLTWGPQTGGVTSVFGRTGVVVAASNDYAFSQISGSVTNAQLQGFIATNKLATLSGTGGTVGTTVGVFSTGKCLEWDASGNIVTGVADAACGAGGGGGAPTDASYVTKVAEAGLSNEFAMGSLGNGLVKNAATTGIPSIAVAGTDYLSPTGTETVSNHTLDNTNTATFKDTLFTLQDDLSATKQARFQLSGIGVGNTRVVTIADADSTTVIADAGAANNFLTAISAGGVISKAQPAFTNLSGSLAAGQLPAFTGGQVTSSAGSAVLAIGAASVTNAMLAGSIAYTKLIGTDIITVGTITTGTWNGTTIAVANGGTGQTTQLAAFNALDPITTKGDLIVHNATNSVRLAVGTNGQVLQADSTVTEGIKWATLSGSGTVTVVSAGSLTSTALVTGGGGTTLQTPSATATLDSSGNLSTPGAANFGVGAATAGFVGLGQGTIQAVTANTIGLTAPTSVTGYNLEFPIAAGDGPILWTNTANRVVGTFPGMTGTGTFVRSISPTLTGTATFANITVTGTCTGCGGSGAPGGSNTQVQFNDGGVLGGDGGLTYNKTTDALTVVGVLSSSYLTTTGSGAGTLGLIEGAAPALEANTFQIYAGVDVAAGGLAYRLPTAGATGFMLATNTAGDMVITHVASSGSGSVCLTTNCSMTTPALGTPSAVVLTNATGTAAGFTAGNVTTNANLTGHVTSTGNAAVLGSFTVAQLNTAISDADVQPLDSDLTAIAALSTNGIVTRTGTGFMSARTIVGTTNEITVSNGDGVSANPTLALSAIVNLSSKTLRIPNSTTLPATCAVGDSYMDTDATTGQRFYLCQATDTWALQGDGGGGGGITNSAGNNVVPKSDGTNIVASLFTDNGTTGIYSGTGGFQTTAAGIGSLGLKDTNDTHYLNVTPGSNLTADRTLTITTGDANRTITLSGDTTLSGTNTGDQTITLTGNVTGTGTGSFAATIGANQVTGLMIALGSDAQGDLMYYDGTNWVRLAPGTSGQFLKTLGAAANPIWDSPAGAGTVTASGGSLTANSVVLGAGTTDTKVVAGITTNGTAQLVLGVNTTTLGSVKMFGNTSGDATIQPAAVAGTATVVTLPNASSTLPIFGQQITFAGPTAARTITLPDAAFTAARTDAANTFTGTQTFGAVVGTTWNGNTWATGTGTLSVAAAKTLTASNTLTLTGTDSSSVAFGAGGTVAYIGAANAWGDGVKQTFNPNGTTSGFNYGSHTADPSSLANADAWYNSTTETVRNYAGGLPGTVVRTISEQHSTTDTLTASTINTTETNFATNFVIPANYLKVGKTFRLTMGHQITSSSTALTLVPKLKFGSVGLTLRTAISPGNSVTNAGGGWIWVITCTATGASGTLETQGVGSAGSIGLSVNNTSQPVTVDTTVSNTLQISITYNGNTAGNSITLRQWILEELN